MYARVCVCVRVCAYEETHVDGARTKATDNEKFHEKPLRKKTQKTFF